MKTIFARTLTIIFTVLAILHFYWAFGGAWGFKNAIPTNEQGIQILKPTTTDSIIVGIVLLLFGLFYVLALKLKRVKILVLARNMGLWMIPMLFVARALGDFKYVGFFKQVKETEFANLDTMFYSPLCLIIGLIGISLIKLKK